MKLLVNAKIFSSKKSQSILIQNEKIIFIGDSKDINISCESLEIIDCKNNSVLPGFIDGHCHPFETISNLSSIDLSKAMKYDRGHCKTFCNIYSQFPYKIISFKGSHYKFVHLHSCKRFSTHKFVHFKCYLKDQICIWFFVIVIVIVHISNVYLLVLSKATEYTFQKRYD